MNEIGTGYQCGDCGDYFPRNQIKAHDGDWFCRDKMGHNRPKAKAAKLSPKMAAALKLAFQAEVGISRTDQSIARSGIAEAWMISTNTGAALVGRDYLSPIKGIHLETGGWAPRQQITAAGCEAIGRSMDEIVAWAWGEAAKEYVARTPDNRYLPTLPVEVGAVVGWTHKGEAITGTVLSIGGGYATIKGDDASPWSVSLDEIERVIELPKAETFRPSLALDYPAATGGVVTQAHANHCAQHGHAQHISEGVNVGICPRCGEPTTCTRCGRPVKQVRQQGTPSLVHVDFMDHAHDHAATLEPPYVIGGREGCRQPRKVTISKFREARERDARLQADLSTGRTDRKALPIVPPTQSEPKSLMALVNDAIAAAVHAEKLASHASFERHSEAKAAATAALEAVQECVNDLERRAIPVSVEVAFSDLLKALGDARTEHLTPGQWRDKLAAEVDAWKAFNKTTIGVDCPPMVIYMGGGMEVLYQSRLDRL